MNQLPIWQMAVDLGLVAAVLTMAFRWMKGSKAQALLPQTIELEAVLRGLIADAEGAGRHLNDQLLRREGNIQKYLTDLEESERKIARSVVEGEEIAKKIESVGQTAQARLQELVSARDKRAASSQAKAPQPATTAASSQQEHDTHLMSEEAERVPRAPLREPAGSRSSPSVKSAATGAASSSGSAQQAASTPRRPAQGYQEAALEGTSLQKVYSAAEKMLRQGVELERVASATKLSLEGVQMLSRLIEVERSSDGRADDDAGSILVGDPRLGALGASRRQPNS